MTLTLTLTLALALTLTLTLALTLTLTLTIYWTQDDTRLVSAGMDGAVYEWQVKETKRMSENVLKSCAYTCAVCAPDARTIYAVGSDHKLKETSDST